MDSPDAIRALSALAQEHRLAVFRLLVAAGPSGLPAGEIARRAGVAPANLTFHMKELEQAGLTHSWREGRFVRSAVHVDGMRAFVTFLTENCCGGRPELCGRAIEPARTVCCGPDGVDQ